jgi:hypothetical protein
MSDTNQLSVRALDLFSGSGFCDIKYFVIIDPRHGASPNTANCQANTITVRTWIVFWVALSRIMIAGAVPEFCHAWLALTYGDGSITFWV